MKRPTGGRFAPPSQVPPISFSLSFSFQFPFNLNYETKRLKTGSRTSTTNKKQRTKKNCKKQSVSQKIDLVMRIQTVQKSSKSELSSVTFGRVKVYKKRAMYPKSYVTRTVIKLTKTKNLPSAEKKRATKLAQTKNFERTFTP